MSKMIFRVFISCFLMYTNTISWSLQADLLDGENSDVDDLNKKNFDEFEEFLLEQADPFDKFKPYRVVDRSAKQQENQIRESLILIDKFSEFEKKESDFKKSKLALEELLKKLGNISGNDKEPPQEVADALISVANSYAEKYQDEMLKENGIYISGSYPGGYIVYLETLEKFKSYNFLASKEYRLIGFKIKQSEGNYSDENLTNIDLIFQNKTGFELERYKIAKINKHGFVTGKFEIEESVYRKIARAYFITDQDVGYDSILIK